MPVDLSGKWEMELNENMEEYLKALGNPVDLFFLIQINNISNKLDHKIKK